MDSFSKDFLRAKILFKLARMRKWHNSHTAFDNLKKGFKPHEQKDVKKISENLIKEGYLLKKPTKYGLHVSLNHHKAQEIKNTVREFLGQFVE